MKVVPVTVGPVRASGVPSLDSCASTISKERSDSIIAGPNSTVQDTVTVDPTSWMVLTGILMMVIEDGAGTKQKKG